MTVLAAVRPPRPPADLWLDYNPDATIPFHILDGAHGDLLMTMRPTLGAALTWIFKFQSENPGTRVDRESIRQAHARSDPGFSLRVEREPTADGGAGQPALALASRHLRIAQ